MASHGFLSLLDIALRGAAIALFLLVAVATLRRGGRRPAAWLGAALAIGAATYAVCSAPEQVVRWPAWFAPLMAICAGNVVVFWLFTQAVFDETFRPRPWHAALWLALAVCPIAVVLTGSDLAVSTPIQIALRIVPVVFVQMALA